MVNLTRIYTRTGDAGLTSLSDGTRVSKIDSRLEAYAQVDELNASLGWALAGPGAPAPDTALGELLRQLQNDLFDLGADLSRPCAEAEDPAQVLRVTEEYITALEDACDSFNADLAPLRSFILPGGSQLAAALHLSRVVARRAERAAWRAGEEYGFDCVGGLSSITTRYLNRISDLLFILARAANQTDGDPLWQPGKRQSGSPS